MKKIPKILIKISVVVTYLGMITVNALANILPINNLNTGQVSDSYPNLFAPIGLTFSIWGLIYLGLAVYTIYQFKKNNSREDLIQNVGIYFIISSLANILWIFAWHYQFIAFSLLLMLIILGCLIKIADRFNQESLSLKEKLLMRLPFSLYFGWITVATIANVTAFLVSLNWSGFGLSPALWTVIVLLVGVAIGLWRMFKDRAIIYGGVFIWAYFGIYLKHVSPDFFDHQYPAIIITTILSMVIWASAIGLLIGQNRANFKKINF